MRGRFGNTKLVVMKKYLLLLVSVLPMSFVFGQNCEQKLEEVIKGFNGFKSCSQRAEMNKLLAKATEVVKECPVYYAQNQDRFLKAKKYVEDTYARLGCVNNGAQKGAQNQGKPSNAATEVLSSLPIFEKQYNFEQQSDALSNVAAGIAGRGIANLVRQSEIEAEIRRILFGRESQYPEATKYFNEYLKEKKKVSRGVWIGTGLAGAGAIVTGIGVLSGGEYDINETMVYAGAGTAVVGLVKILFSVSASKKREEALQNAKRSLTLTSSSTGMGVSFKF